MKANKELIKNFFLYEKLQGNAMHFILFKFFICLSKLHKLHKDGDPLKEAHKLRVFFLEIKPLFCEGQF